MCGCRAFIAIRCGVEEVIMTAALLNVNVSIDLTVVVMLVAYLLVSIWHKYCKRS